MNGDLLTNLDFKALTEKHRAERASATVSIFGRDERLPFGILRVDEMGDAIGYEEKPTMHMDVSMGAYVMSPKVLELVPDTRYDMPQLIEDLIAAGNRVATYRHTGIWFDIGRVDDYEQANQLFKDNPGAFVS
jgi:NDP-sugar pyrophosphorylase family protein